MWRWCFIGDILELYKFIKEYFSINVAVNVALIVLAGVFFLKVGQLKHPRYRLRYVVFVLLLLFILNATIIKLANTAITILLLVLLAMYCLTAYISSKKPILFSNRKLKSLKELLRIGYSLNDETLFDKKPFYIIDFIEKYQYLVLKAEHFIALARFADAYELYQSVNEDELFDEEKPDLFRKKAFILYTLGDMNKASHSLNRINDESEPNYLLLKSMIAGTTMDIEGANRYLQKALSLTSDNREPLLTARIYNNYGRSRFIEGNYTDAVTYYQLSCKIAKNQKDRELLHVSYQNLIHTCILKGDKEKGVKCFEEYEKLITDKTLNDINEEFNLRVEIARQNESNEEISKVILEGYEDIRPLLTTQRQKIFDVCVLRMMFNNKMKFDMVMDRIYDNINDYFSYEMPERYFALKEINIPLREIRFPHCHKYASVHNRINNYMIKDAVEEIDRHISELKDYELYQRCNMEREKIGVLKEWVKPYKFETSYNMMSDIKDIYHKNGMFIDAIFLDLDIADECFAPANYLGNEIKPMPKKKMAEHVELADDKLSKLKKYPRVVEGNIRLAFYYMALGEKEKAKEHFDDFEDAKIQINHFAIWVQRYYEILRREFRKM